MSELYQQTSLFNDGEGDPRRMLDQLLEDSRLYRHSREYMELLDFVVRLRNFAPFNAMLLQIQKPGLAHAASARDWREQFDRRPKEDARPLLILWPFGPVALVYDVQDTEGAPLPENLNALTFQAIGPINKSALADMVPGLCKLGIQTAWTCAAGAWAGSITQLSRPENPKEKSEYRMAINNTHPPAVQFGTLAHELGHLALGHLGPDKFLSIPGRVRANLAMREIEAESVAYLVCRRNGVWPNSDHYLAAFVRSDTRTDQLDIYQIMRAAGQVETWLGLAAHTRFDRP